MVARLAGPLDERHVLVVGAGETAKLAALHLARLRPSRLIVANRTRAHAEAIAARVGGTAIDLAGLPAALARADVVVSATSRHGAVISADLVRQVMAARPAHPLLAVDLAVPRDIEAPAGAVPGVTLLDLDRVQADARRTWRARRIVGAAGRDDRRRGGARLRGMAARHRRRRRHSCAARTGRGRAGRALERSRRSDLDRDALDRQTRLLMNRLLHPTMLRLKTLAGSRRGRGAAVAVARAPVALTNRLYHLPTVS